MESYSFYSSLNSYQVWMLLIWKELPSTGVTTEDEIDLLNLQKYIYLSNRI